MWGPSDRRPSGIGQVELANMWVETQKDGGIGFMIGALLLLGTWPALLNLCERKGRHPAHTFLDYSFTNYLVAIIVALTLGQIGSSTPETPNFATQVHQNNGPSVGFAVGGGILLMSGNLAVQYALAFVGLAVAETTTSSMTVVGGTTINWFLDGRINNPAILFPGVGCFLLAVFLGAGLHISNTRDNEKKLGLARTSNPIGDSIRHRQETGATLTPPMGFELPAKPGVPNPEDSAHKGDGVGMDYDPKLDVKPSERKPAKSKSAVGSAAHAAEVEEGRAIKISGSSVMVGLALCCISGTSYILFSPAVNLATNDQWHKLAEGVPHLVVYTAFFYFSTAFFGASVILNVIFLYRPVLGLPKSSLGAYVKDMNCRHWAFLAGALCGVGNTFQFMGGQAAGYAAADSVQALPLVSTFWAIFLFGEYRRSSPRTYVLLAGMLCAFAAAVGLLMGSAGTRKPGS